MDEEVIEVPKKKIKDEVNILSDDKRQNQIKKQIRIKEDEEDKEKRKIEMDLNSKKMEEYNQQMKILKIKIRKKTTIAFLKYLLLIIIISGSLIGLIIYLDKRVKAPPQKTISVSSGISDFIWMFNLIKFFSRIFPMFVEGKGSQTIHFNKLLLCKYSIAIISSTSPSNSAK